MELGRREAAGARRGFTAPVRVVRDRGADKLHEERGGAKSFVVDTDRGIAPALRGFIFGLAPTANFCLDNETCFG